MTVAPALCPHADACGGCLFQDQPLKVLASAKRDRLASALERAGVEAAAIAPTLQSPMRSRRRVKFAAVRGKKRIALGFRRSRAHDVIDIDTCLIARPEIIAASDRLRDLARIAAPRARAIDIHVVASDGGLDVAVDGAKSLDLDLRTAAAAWAETADVARLTWNGEPVAVRRPPRHRVGRALVEPAPAGFLQATQEGEAALARMAVDAVAGAARVADLFSGCGAITLPLAENAEVLAVDGDAAAIAALDAAWRAADGLKRVVAQTRDLFRRPLSAAELRGVDAVVFDPPRAGAAAQTAQLAEADLQVVVGVSCNPTTFARDARVLQDGGWRLETATPIDQFLWSPHVELVGVFRRGS